MATGEAYKEWAVFTDSTSMTSFICLCLLPADRDPPMLPCEVVGQRLPLRVIGRHRATCSWEPGGGGLSINYGTAVMELRNPRVAFVTGEGSIGPGQPPAQAIQTGESAPSSGQPAGSRGSPEIQEEDEQEDAGILAA